MQSLTQQSSATQATDSSGAARLRPAATFALLTLAALWFVLCRQLSSEWSVNEQYNYGWFVPFFAAYLFWLRWEDRPLPEQIAETMPRTASHTPHFAFMAIAIATLSLLLLAPLRLFEIGNPDWRPLDWIHTAAVVALTLVGVWRAGGKAWVRHFAFPIAFIFVAVPWISAIEQPVVQGLMRIVAVVAAEITNLFGIPAEVEGNLIRLNSGLVGVNEACSGVRSIQTSLMIGLLFGELRRLTVIRRIALVAIALAVAIVGNFARAFSLVWVSATRAKEAFTSWHDIAGYSIVAVVFVACVAAASWLGRPNAESQTPSASASDYRPSEFRNPKSTHPAFHLSAFFLLIAFAWLLAVEAGAEIWYRAHESKMVPRLAWSVRWPENADGFREIPIDEEIKTTLRFDEGREASWVLPGASESVSPATTRFSRTPRCLLFFFRWEPGGSSVVRARAHRPDICLPSAGWRFISDSGTRDFRAGAGLMLPFRRVSFAREGGTAIAHTYFCLYEDRRTREARPDLELPAGMQPDWSFPARWRAVRDGVRNMGQQVMEFIFINNAHEAEVEKADAQFAALLPMLVNVRQ